MESKTHCSQIEAELEKVKMELDDFQLEYKSSQEEIEILKSENSSIRGQVQLLEDLVQVKTLELEKVSKEVQ